MSCECHVSSVIYSCVWFVCFFMNFFIILVVEKLKERALARYSAMMGSGSEHLVTGSDDYTLFLWNAGHSKKPVARMTGEHVKPIS